MGAIAERATINLPLRVSASLAVAALCFSAIAFRLWYLQVIHGEYFRDKSENNRLQTVFIPPPRGLLKDRNGKVLVANRPSFNVELIEEDTPNPKRSVMSLARVIDEAPHTLLEKLRSQKRRRKFEPKLLVKDASRDLVAKVAAHRHRLPGVIITVVPARNYLEGEGASHVIGYIREITQKQLESPRYPTYMAGDLVGQFGIEEQWERYLQGRRGRQRVIVNATGTRVGELTSEGEIAGSDITLTLDARVQRAADDALADKKGAIVAMDPNTGEILAMSSSPRFDPNLFTQELTGRIWRDLTTNKKMVNKAIQGQYPPGSVFKIFMAAAGLANGTVKPKDRVFCSGSFWFAGRAYKCHKKTGHGTVDLYSAMVQSCDVYFYTLGNRLGVDLIHEYATRFGLGDSTGIALPNEATGLIPSTEWKRRAFKNPANKKWFAGETLSVSIGQGAVTTTPLQIARGVSALISGKVLEPQLVRAITAGDGRVIEDRFEPVVIRPVNISPEILKTVRDTLVGVVNDPRGTGKRSRLTPLNITVGGKTGTAQVVGLHHDSKDEEFQDHAWFVGFAPAEAPKLVVVALAENGGHGGAAAAPLVAQVMTAFFDPDGLASAGSL